MEKIKNNSEYLLNNVKAKNCDNKAEYSMNKSLREEVMGNNTT